MGVETQQLPEGAVVGVVVTRHRRDLLSHSLKIIAAQTRAVDHLVVVDNGPDQSARDVIENYPLPCTYLPSHRNLGGAGGFALGMLHALSLGADWIWLADDDGRPADENVLSILLEEAEKRGLAEISPVVANIDTPTKLAFPLRRGLTWKRSSAELGEDFLPGIASLMNGALFRASTLDVVGVPDLRLFFRGDEVELHRRLVRSGLPFGTSLKTKYLHPDGSDEFKVENVRAGTTASLAWKEEVREPRIWKLKFGPSRHPTYQLIVARNSGSRPSALPKRPSTDSACGVSNRSTVA